MRTQAVIAAVLLAAGFGCAELPDYTPPNSVTTLDQNWTEAQRRWFYHASQGTRLLPASWFLALEQPRPSLVAVERFAAPDYLARFGFLPDPVSPDNPDGLPVGFARDSFPVDGQLNAPPEAVVGLTCAACHTGQVEFGGRALRIDGGPAMTDTGAFQDMLGAAILLTAESEPRFNRFAARVLTGNDTPETRAALRERLNAALAAGRTERGLAARGALYPVEEGFGRLDALGRGGNFVFATQTGDTRNLAVADGPVSYPALWDAPWFDWVQYNGAIRQPMGRNLAEAMGVRSVTKLSGPPESLYASTVRPDTIHAMERQLAGPAPGEGLRSPPWPQAVLGPIDAAMAERGKAHYARLCAGCHDGGWTAPDAAGRRYRQITMVPLARIGTDPKAARNFAERRAFFPPGGEAQVSAAEGLREVTTRVAQRWYEAAGVPPGQRAEMDGYRTNDWRAPAAYRARPLNGIWATAPYLHNGSVPSLYQMLLPAERRDAAFFTGSRQFDPRAVGFSTAPFDGGFRFDTAIPGNSNRGHEFRDGLPGNGTIGPALTEDQRWELVEYLKTL
ncbi:di-heme-cytochrome C peroxidase [Roseomonas sp. BN140053]|uniref:di-heme-cytochrome C peroxidase n=1 Tax=Roseomonas sp. BN140053 TaxID=3391898 RepID=UPI0039EAD4B4